MEANFEASKTLFLRAFSSLKNSPCRKRSPAKGVWQKSDEKSGRSIRESDRKVAESVPKTKKVIELLLPHSFCGENALKMASTKARLLKHDFPVHGRRCDRCSYTLQRDRGDRNVSGTFWWPQPPVFSQKYCRTNGRRTAVPFATKTWPTRKKYFRIIFRLPFHDFDFFELILEIYPIPIAFVWVVWHYPVGTPVLVELFFITVTRFEVFRINWVMFSWQMVQMGGVLLGFPFFQA